MITIPINFDIPEIPRMEIEREMGVANSNFATYSDSNYSSPQVNFNPRQTVYVKIDKGTTGNVNTEVVLLDSNKNKVSDITLVRNNDYYAAEFSAPGSGGVYYLHLEIQGDGISISGERNINVTGNEESDSNSYVLSNVEQYVVSDNIDANLRENNEASDGVDTTESKTDDILFIRFMWSIWDKLNSFFFKH